MTRIAVTVGIVLAALATAAAGVYGAGERPSAGTPAPPALTEGKMVRTYGIDVSGKIKAPDFDGAVAWLNVDKPLTIEELRGKVVLLDFWTYCCINCMHIIPDLKFLEEKYPRELVVIGIHSAKFSNEKDDANIRQAILRYGIEHPVANDANFAIWNRYTATGWPYIVIIDPEGRIVGTVSGEGNRQVLDETIAAIIDKFGDKINRKPIPLALEKDKAPETVLAFPGKVLADEPTGRLFIADSGHNRILVSDFSGHVSAVIGSGAKGMDDGAQAEATFNHPQGMAIVGSTLFVADTENHAVRAVDLDKGTVDTVVGTGAQSRTWRGGQARQTALNSPWDLAALDSGNSVYIAMAGSHQIWVYIRDRERVEPFAGSGREALLDGPVESAALAQPSGITSIGSNLYIADSESSGLRMVDMRAAPRVRTLIGTGLFDFGDADGPFSMALLQHPLGVAAKDRVVYVADTYNHKIKVADLETQTIRTIAGTGKPGVGTPEAPQFYEPGGLSATDNKIFIADTNNNAVRIMDLQTGKTHTLDIDLSAAAPKKPVKFDLFGKPDAIDLAGKAIPAEGAVKVKFDFPEGYHFNTLAKQSVQLRVTGRDGAAWVGEKFEPKIEGGTLSFNITAGGVNEPARVEAVIIYYYCTEDGGQCMIRSVLIDGQAGQGKGTLELDYKVGK